MLPALLADLEACPEVKCVVLTRNIPEPPLDPMRPEWLSVIDNPHPKGFGANHNAAFRLSDTPYFAVINPDVRLEGDPFLSLLRCLQDGGAALCAPAVINPAGNLEDSAREFPRPFDLVAKLFGRYDGRLRYRLGDSSLNAPWVAGMFMLFRSPDFSSVNGFDEGYYLYYEDVDLCARLWSSGKRVILCPDARVVHDARRASRRNLRHMRWHFASMLRFFIKHVFRQKTSQI